MHELPLVFFTVLAQASAGLLILSVINQLINRKATTDQALFKMGVACLILVALAGGSAILHLGRPFRAMNALFGTGRSPMSNEIVSCAVYGGLLFISLAVMYLRPKLKGLLLLLRVITAVSAVVLIVLIPRVYTLLTIPQWDTHFTSYQMILAAFTSGGALALIWQPTRLNMVITVFAAVLGFLIIPSYMAHLSASSPEMLMQGMGFFDAKLALYAVALVLAVYSYKKRIVPVALSSGVVFIVAELAGRIAFYDLWSIGM
ncbi:hypothetical protein F9817_17655 [Vibrio sp. CAIM 722]|uniref:Anaerobic dimethyl sulfoxide reductase chain C n=1 Tax=Vibrio eleionomae TaxID=2653505 RepID=A0A7X4LNF4_9VIBR|nr:DmsC/YnfH family molybdoenzyme membrane anchor subunit [Vibrio eleionomae]MZI95006.1 hypothetical protein [Vibrio eleionomae]